MEQCRLFRGWSIFAVSLSSIPDNKDDDDTNTNNTDDDKGTTTTIVGDDGTVGHDDHATSAPATPRSRFSTNLHLFLTVRSIHIHTNHRQNHPTHLMVGPVGLTRWLGQYLISYRPNLGRLCRRRRLVLCRSRRRLGRPDLFSSRLGMAPHHAHRDRGHLGRTGLGRATRWPRPPRGPHGRSTGLPSPCGGPRRCLCRLACALACLGGLDRRVVGVGRPRTTQRGNKWEWNGTPVHCTTTTLNGDAWTMLKCCLLFVWSSGCFCFV